MLQLCILRRQSLPWRQHTSLLRMHNAVTTLINTVNYYLTAVFLLVLGFYKFSCTCLSLSPGWQVICLLSVPPENSTKLAEIMCGWRQTRGVVHFYCERVVYACVQCLCHVWRMSPLLHVVSHVWWFWFWARGGDRQPDTLGNLWSPLLLHKQVFQNILTPRDWWRARKACVFVVQSLFSSWVCMQPYVWLKYKGQGEKLDFHAKERSILFALVMTFGSIKAI